MAGDAGAEHTWSNWVTEMDGNAEFDGASGEPGFVALCRDYPTRFLETLTPAAAAALIVSAVQIVKY